MRTNMSWLDIFKKKKKPKLSVKTKDELEAITGKGLLRDTIKKMRKRQKIQNEMLKKLGE